MPGLCPACRAGLREEAEARTCPACGLRLERRGRLWRTGRREIPAGFDDAAAARLASLEGHFWLRGRRALVARLLDRLGPGGGRAVELGCGPGELLPLLEARFAQVWAVDGHPSLLARAAARSARAELFEADVSRTPLPGGEADLVLALDVIEHVPPAAFLAEVRRLAAPGGLILLSAPACPALWSAMDERAGHRRRYTRADLAAELGAAGLVPLGHTHYQFLLFPLVRLSRALRRGGAALERRPPRWLGALLGGVNRLEVAALSGLPLPFGSSVFLWARAPAATP